MEVVVLVEVCKLAGAGRHGVAVEGIGVVCRRLGGWPEWWGESGDI